MGETRFGGGEPSQMPLDELVHRTGGALGRFYQFAAAEHGLSPTAIGVLRALLRADGVSHRELAAMVGRTPATLTPVVDALESAGELTRERDATDRRIVRISATEHGRQRVAEVGARAAATIGARVPRPRPEEAAVIRDYLLAVLAAVGDEP